MPGGSKKGGGLKTKKSAFYMRSGNSPLFKTMGSSPAKESTYKSSQEIKQESKTARVKARGSETPGGRKVTKEEKSSIRDTKLSNKLARAEGLEAEGKGEKGFSWKEAGKSILRGEGLLGNIQSGMGKGRDKSAIIKDKQAKIAGRKERKDIRSEQKAKRKSVSARVKDMQDKVE